MSRVLPSTLAVLGGNLLYNEVANLGKELKYRARKRVANYLFGSPYRHNTRSYRTSDRSLMRLTSVRRPSTKRRLSRGRYARRRKRPRYSRRRVRRTRARRAMGTNGPAFRTRQHATRYRAQLGEPFGHSPSRKETAAGSTSTIKDKTLTTTRLVKVPWSDNDTTMNSRTGKLCDVVGVKFRAWISLKSNIVENSVIFQDPIQVRWAILNPRINTGAAADVTAGTEFFDNMNPGNDDDASFPASGNCFLYMNRKINTRKYGVLQEGTFVLATDPGSNNTRLSLGAKKFITFYVPINRQMKWSNNDTATESDYPKANLHFVWWFVKQGDKDGGQSYAANQPFDYHWEHTTYFRNPEILG